jgi:dTDP-4-dehydrorhamnose reductase
MSALKILVLGATGFMGLHLSKYLKSCGHTVFGMSASGGDGAEYCVDGTNQLQMRELIRRTSPNVIFNLIACTNVDECELDPRKARHLNVLPATILADELKGAHSVHLIQISTDQVYQGVGPHSENNTSPCNIYGSTKLAAESELKEINATVFRTNFVGKSYSQKRESLTDWFINSLINEKNILLFDDIRFSPLHISTLCKILEQSIHIRLGGVFNLGSVGCVTKASLLMRMSDLVGIDSGFVKISASSELVRLAKRPYDMSLNVEKFTQAFDIKLPSIDETINILARDYYDLRT